MYCLHFVFVLACWNTNVGLLHSHWGNQFMHTVCIYCCGFLLVCFTLFFRVAALALGQSGDCPNSCGTIMKNMGEYITWIHCRDDIIKWQHLPGYWFLVRGINQSPVGSSHKGQWHGALMFSLIYTWTNGWANNGDTGDLRCNHAQYDVTEMAKNCKDHNKTENIFLSYHWWMRVWMGFCKKHN